MNWVLSFFNVKVFDCLVDFFLIVSVYVFVFGFCGGILLFFMKNWEVGVIVLLSKCVGVLVLIGWLLSIVSLFFFLIEKGVFDWVNVVGISFVGMNWL